jgi:serine phosphatase RsbU (regulator of sigma subunit)
MYPNYIDQRDTFKLVEKLIAGDYPDVQSMLKSMVKEIVDLNHFDIIGGRIWELNSLNLSYKLVYQYGKFNRIPDEYEIKIEDQPILKDLSTKHVLLSSETDFTLKELGIKLYSVIGIGEIFKLKIGKYYEFAVGFNAPEIQQTFFELLNIISGVASSAILNLRAKSQLQNELVSTKKFQRDLDKASEIQRQLLPNHYKRFHDFDVYGHCIPDEGVGGDYFDYIIREDIEDDSLSIVISDAASKGLPAAIQSLFVSGAIRMGLSYATRIADVFAKLNTLIFDTFVYERFVTLFYCELTLSENRMVLYLNAGHPAPIHYRPQKDKISHLNPTGGLLGITRNQKFGIENIRMHRGDVLVLYTDGITEAMNAESEMFGEDRIADIIKIHHKRPAKEICLLVIEEVQKFTAGSSHVDDRTVIVIKRDREEITENIESN